VAIYISVAIYSYNNYNNELWIDGMYFIFAHHVDTTGMTTSDIFEFYFRHFSGQEPPPPSCVVWGVSIFGKTAYYPRHVRPTCPSIRVYRRSSSGRISIKFDIGCLLRKPVEKFQFFFFIRTEISGALLTKT